MPIDQMPSAGVSATGYSAQIPSGGPAQVDPPVWTGGTFDEGAKGRGPVNANMDPFTVHRKPESSKQVIGEFSRWTNKRKKNLARRLALAGYFGAPRVGESLDDFVASIPLAQLEEAWGQVVMETAQKNANGVWVTPDQNIQQQIDYNQSAAKGTSLEGWYTGASGGTEGEDPNRTEKFVSVSRDIFSASQAKGLIRGVLQQELGRDPTAEEFEDFITALQTKQRENPTRTVQRTIYRDGDPVRQSTTSTGGIDPAEFALEQAQANPDWAEWQAIGTYFPAVMNTLGAGVPGA